MTDSDQIDEEILEAIWTCAEMGEHAVAAVTRHCHADFSDERLTSLEARGVVALCRGVVLLTPEGRRRAERVIRRHRLAQVLMRTVLTLKQPDVDEIACELEHTLHPEVEEAICILLGHPEACPDGRPIPRGRCCGEDTRTVGKVVAPLSELRAGESGRVTYIKPGSHAHLHRLLSFGLAPGVVVTVECEVPAVCVRFEETELALDDEIARSIFILKMDGDTVDLREGGAGRGHP